MTITTFLAFVVLYSFLVGILTLIGSKRKIGRLRVFLLSFFMTPLAGIVAFSLSEPIYVLKLTRYRCPKCSIEFTETIGECPFCRRDGLVTRLQTVVMRTV